MRFLLNIRRNILRDAGSRYLVMIFVRLVCLWKNLSLIHIFIGEYPEAVAVMLFYQVGEFFQSLAVERSKKSISDLMDIRPDCATVRRNGELITISPCLLYTSRCV